MKRVPTLQYKNSKTTRRRCSWWWIVVPSVLVWMMAWGSLLLLLWGAETTTTAFQNNIPSFSRRRLAVDKKYNGVVSQLMMAGNNNNNNTSNSGGGGFFGKMKKSFNFFEERQGDFVKLSDTQPEYGPGPLVVLYNVPSGVTNDEIRDMLDDGAPQAMKRGVTLFRVDESNTETMHPKDRKVLDRSMQEALEGIATGNVKDHYKESTTADSGSGEAFPNVIGREPPIVVTLFSGFTNEEMLAAYRILSSEIYQEAQLEAACAKAVPNAMEKPLRQVLEEIGGDHRDAMQQNPTAG